MAAKDKNEVAVQEQTTTALALLGDEFAADAGGGFEDAESNSFAIPFLKLLAAMSKQCKKGTAEYLKGAEEGMFYNTVTGELFDGEVGLDVIPVHFTPKFLEFEGTVDEGGGFVRTLSSADGARLMATTYQDSDGNSRLPRGEDGKEHILVDIREHYLIALRPGTTEMMPVILGLSSSAIPVSKGWMSMMSQFKRNPKQMGPDPMFSHVFHLTSFMKASKKVDTMYATYRFTHVCPIENAPWEPEVIQSIYNAAKEFKQQLASGVAKAADTEYASDRTEFDPDKF